MKWKFENIDVIFTCHEDDFERTSNYNCSSSLFTVESSFVYSAN